MKKILAFLLCLVFVIQMCPWVTAEETLENTSLNDAVKLLSTLEIISQFDDETYGIDEEVTRAEIAVIAARMLKINENEKADEQYFTDMPVGHWATYAVNTLAERGIISPGTTFRPDDVIETDEAVKLFTAALGYGEPANYEGGYPAGYYKTATRIDLLNGVKLSNKNILRGDVIQMAYNCFNIHIMDAWRYTEEGAIYEIAEQTMLEEYWDMQILNGIADGVWGINLNETVSLERGYVSVNGTKYKTEISDIDQYLACDIEFLAYVPKEQETGELITVFSKRDTKQLILYSDNIISYEDGKITYYEENKEKTANLSAQMTVVKNGAVIEQGYRDAFDIKKGSVTLTDADGKNGYETAVIKEAETGIISQINDEKIYFKDGVSAIDLDTEVLKICSRQGGAIDVTSLSAGNVLTIFRSKDYAEVYQSTETITGKINLMHGDAAGEITIDDKRYKVDYKLWQTKSGFFAVGKSVTVKTDIYDEIVYAEIAGGSAAEFGYIIAAKMIGGAFSSPITLKLFGQDNVMSVLELAERVTVDGVSYNSYSNQQLFTLLQTPKLAVITKDESGKIIKIDTPMKGEEEWNDTLELVEPLSEVNWYSTPKTFGPKIAVNNSTVIFSIPDDAVIASSDENKFYCGDYTFLPWGVKLRAEGYKLDKDNAYADVVIVRTDSTGYAKDDNRNGLLLVESIEKILNDEGEEVFALNGFRGGAEVTLMTADGAVLQDSATGTAVESGDIIEMSLTMDMEISQISIVYDMSSGKKPDWAPLKTGNYYDVRSYLFGYVKKKHTNVIEVGYDNVDNTIDAVLNLEKKTIVIYDTARRKEKAYIGSIDDVIDYTQVSGACARVVVHMQYAAVNAIFVYI